VDPADKSQTERLSVKPATLQNIFDVFLKTRERQGAPSASAAPSTSAPSHAAATPNVPVASAEDKAAADALKAEGNAHMTAKRYDQAIDAYTRAIGKDGSNAVFYSNRAAAHISLGDYPSAASDAETAIELDPSFVRAYSRLG
jgi:small glutamine-rich tetratricopeptide repeat-containing protein alpha